MYIGRVDSRLRTQSGALDFKASEASPHAARSARQAVTGTQGSETSGSTKPNTAMRIYKAPTTSVKC